MTLLALAGWLSGCTSDPPNVLEPGNAGAPGVKRFIACAPNTVIALPAELQSGTLTLHEQIDAYLHFHDREAQWLDLYESRQRWSEAVEAAKAQGQIEKAPAIFAQDLAKHYEFDAILIPSILLHQHAGARQQRLVGRRAAAGTGRERAQAAHGPRPEHAGRGDRSGRHLGRHAGHVGARAGPFQDGARIFEGRGGIGFVQDADISAKARSWSLRMRNPVVDTDSLREGIPIAFDPYLPKPHED